MEEDNKYHTHTSADGAEFTHCHEEGQPHAHKNTKVVLNRLSRAIGHLESVKRMVSEGRDCSEVLVHIENCIVEAVESGDRKAIDDLNHAIDRFIK